VRWAALLASLVTLHAPLWTLPAPAAGLGFTMVNIGALVRARWSFHMGRFEGRRATAYAVESILDELVYVLGPLTATVLATHTDSLVTSRFCLLGGRGRHVVVPRPSVQLSPRSALPARGHNVVWPCSIGE